MEPIKDKKRDRGGNLDQPKKKLKVNEEKEKILTKKTKTFPFGNYSGYYGYRLKPGEVDPRVSAVEYDYVHNKKVLDIGCNSGVFTIQLACHYMPQVIVGIDIDKSLVNKARKNIKYWTKRLGCSDDMGSRIQFLGGNYLEEAEFDHETFDTIICFSVTKWIHLNFGDEGLLAFFKKVYSQLEKDGYFLLEAQEWKSYSKSKKVSETASENWESIRIKPNSFPKILEEMGFAHVNTINPPKSISSGFDRPIQVLKKIS